MSSSACAQRAGWIPLPLAARWLVPALVTGRQARPGSDSVRICSCFTFLSQKKRPMLHTSVVAWAACIGYRLTALGQGGFKCLHLLIQLLDSFEQNNGKAAVVD